MVILDFSAAGAGPLKVNMLDLFSLWFGEGEFELWVLSLFPNHVLILGMGFWRPRIPGVVTLIGFHPWPPLSVCALGTTLEFIPLTLRRR